MAYTPQNYLGFDENGSPLNQAPTQREDGNWDVSYPGGAPGLQVGPDGTVSNAVMQQYNNNMNSWYSSQKAGSDPWSTILPGIFMALAGGAAFGGAGGAEFGGAGGGGAGGSAAGLYGTAAGALNPFEYMTLQELAGTAGADAAANSAAGFGAGAGAAGSPTYGRGEDFDQFVNDYGVNSGGLQSLGAAVEPSLVSEVLGPGFQASPGEVGSHFGVEEAAGTAHNSPYSMGDWFDELKKQLKYDTPLGQVRLGGNVLSILSSLRNAGASRRAGDEAARRSDPFGPYRAQYAGQLSNLTSNPDSITSMPGYQAGLKAVERRGAAQGWNGSGNMMESLAQYGGKFYGDEVNRLSGLSGATIPPGAAGNQYYQSRLASMMAQNNALAQMGMIAGRA